MRALIPILLLSALLSCDNDLESKVCGKNHPAEEIPWLNSLISEMESSDPSGTIDLYRYKGQYVFLITHCSNCTDALTLALDCEQNEICKFGGFAGFNICPDFEDKAQFIEKIL
ncbi:MAG: hypothetical protein P8X57_16270 [Cyclobacteriaceae bacterium]